MFEGCWNVELFHFSSFIIFIWVTWLTDSAQDHRAAEMLQAPGTVEDVDVLGLMMLVIKAPKNRRVGLG